MAFSAFLLVSSFLLVSTLLFSFVISTSLDRGSSILSDVTLLWLVGLGQPGKPSLNGGRRLRGFSGGGFPVGKGTFGGGIFEESPSRGIIWTGRGTPVANGAGFLDDVLLGLGF